MSKYTHVRQLTARRRTRISGPSSMCVALMAVVALCLPRVASSQVEAAGTTLTLDQALRMVGERNPELRALAMQTRSAELLLEYEGRNPNPTLGVVIEDFVGSGPLSGFSESQTTLNISQTFVRGGKLAANRELAAARLSVAQIEYLGLRAELIAETMDRFVHVVADQQRLTVAVQARELSELGLQEAARRVAIGAASLVEERRARIASVRSEIRQDHAQHELLASKRRLSMMWGEDSSGFDWAEAELFAAQSIPSYEDLAARIDNNPGLVQIAEEHLLQRAKIAVAEADATADLGVNLGLRRHESLGEYSVVFGMSMPLPLFQSNEGPIAAAKSKKSGLGATKDAARVRLLSMLYGLTQELNHSQDVLTALEVDMLPDARSVLDLVSAGFGVGRFSQIELLDAQRVLVELQSERIDEAEGLLQFMIQINSIVGAAQLELEHMPSQGEGDE